MVKVSEKLNLLMLISKAQAIVSRKFHSQGFSLGDVMVLQAIAEAPNEKIRCVDLSEHVGLTPSGVTRLLVPLDKLGVVKRETNEQDARSSYIMLTKSGKEMLKDAITILEEKSQDFIPNNDRKTILEACQLLGVISK